MDIREIVVLCLSPLGDTIFATPAIRALREYSPKARILILASPAAREVLRDNPYQLMIRTVAEQGGLLRNLSLVRQEGFDLAISLSQIGSFFTKFCGGRRWSDFSVIEYQSNQSVKEMCLQVVEVLGIRTRDAVGGKTEFWFRERDSRNVERWLQLNGYQKGQPLVAVHCGGQYFPRKRWPSLNFSALIRRLTAELDAQVVLVGGSSDQAIASNIQRNTPGLLNSTGALKLAETGALLTNCQLLIGNDSGPLHLAAALQVPTIGLFGPTNPEQFYPYHLPQHHYIYKGLGCSPCYKFGGGVWQYIPRCSKAYCMEEITVDEVFNLVRREFIRSTLLTNGALS